MIDKSKPIPFHYQLYLALKEWLTSAFTLNEVLPTEIEIAKKYDVGRGTVRTAMDALVKDEIVARFPGKGTFLVSDYFVKLKRYNIGVVLSRNDFIGSQNPEYTWSHNLEMINGIIDGCVKMNLGSELISGDIFHDHYNEIYDGFIVYPYVPDYLWDTIKKPFVKVELDMNFLSGFRVIAEEVLQGNYENISYIGLTNQERLTTVNNVLKTENKDIKSENVEECGGSIDEGYQAAKSLLKRSPTVDCIVCSTDFRAIGVMKYLREIDKKIPEDVSVFGFDGEKNGEISSPPLTTCKFDWQYPGTVAVRNMRRIFDGQPVEKYVAPSGKLIIRNSTIRKVLEKAV